MYNFKIDKIITNDKTVIKPLKINIIVGHNNAGKSQFLKDIKYRLTRDYVKNSIIIKDIEFNLPINKEEFINRYNIRNKIHEQYNNLYLKNYCGISNDKFDTNNSFYTYLDNNDINLPYDWETQLENFINGVKVIKNFDFNYEQFYGNIDSFLRQWGELFYSYIGTEEKLLMCKKQRFYGILDYQTNFLSEINASDSNVLNDLSKKVKELFNVDVTLDTDSFGGNILFRVGKDLSYFKNSIRSDKRVSSILTNESMLDDEGDGLKSFIANYLSLTVKDKNLILLDEPEAFLHPPLAFQLGKIIANLATDDKQIFISTHSQDIIKGIISVEDNVKIIRINRMDNINNITELGSSEVKEILKQPVLISSNIMNGLFCKIVYITESFSDSLFFQELLVQSGKNVDGFYFVNVEGKDKIPVVAEFYRKFGVNCISVYDFDFLNSKDTIYKALYNRMSHDKYNDFVNISDEIKNEIKNKYPNKVKEMYHRQGIRCLKDTYDQCQKIINIARNYNILILKNGELETCMEEFGVAYCKDKNKWLDNALNKLYDNSLNREKILKSKVYNMIFDLNK